jgi:hypothetical protein
MATLTIKATAKVVEFFITVLHHLEAGVHVVVNVADRKPKMTLTLVWHAKYCRSGSQVA